MKGKARGCAAVLVLAALALATFTATASALPARFWGVVPQATPSQEQLQRLRRGGVDSVRVPVDWSTLQPRRNGSIDWSGFDEIVARASSTEVELLPFVTGAPNWAVRSVSVPGTGGGVKAPAHLPVSGSAAGAWKQFLRQAVQRYGPGGEFWSENPELPKQPIRVWQIWNEQNFKYFVARPNPAEYGKLVKISYAAIRGADSGAQLVLGGMFSQPKGARNLRTGKHKSLNWYASDFLEQVYKRTPGVKRKFNGVALHPYAYWFQRLTPEIEELREVMARFHDGGKGLWITELGWSSEHPTHSDLFAKGVNGQAKQLKGAFSLLERKQAKWRLRRVYWFSVDDQSGACNFCGGSGLFGDGFKPKKAWYAYVHFAGGRP